MENTVVHYQFDNIMIEPSDFFVATHCSSNLVLYFYHKLFNRNRGVYNM